LSGEIWFWTASELSAGIYYVSEGDPHEESDITAVLRNYPDEIEAVGGEVVVTSADSAGAIGNFFLELSDGSTFSGDFNVIYGMSSPNTYIIGSWNGCFVSEYGASAHHSVWENTSFDVTYMNHEQDVGMWFGVNGAIEVGRTYAMPQDAWLDMRWLVEGQPGFDEFYLVAPGTLIITRYDATGIAGTFDMGPTLTGSFDVSYWEQWEPDM
jgi:hypothetical protein